MSDKNVLEKVNEMEETVLLVEGSALSKEQIINRLKDQVRGLREFILSYEDERSSASKYKTSNSQNTTAILSEPVTRIADDDLNQMWKICACESTDCTTCQAEHEASLSADRWFEPQRSRTESGDSGPSRDDTGHMTNRTTDVDTYWQNYPYTDTGVDDTSFSNADVKCGHKPLSGAASQSHAHWYRDADPSDRMTSYSEYMGKYGDPSQTRSRCMCHQYVAELQYVTSQFDAAFYETGYSTKYVLLLHRSLSVTTFPDRDGSLYACGVVSLIFAHRIITAEPKGIHEHHGGFAFLTDSVYEIVSSSLRDGLDTYSANYGQSCRKLFPSDIVLLLSDLNITLNMEESLLGKERLASCLCLLDLRRIILLIRLEDYKVWSICRRGSSNDLIIIDCQSHNIYESYKKTNVEHGAFIYQITRGITPVIKTLALIEKHSGPFNGPFKVAVIDV